MDKIKAFIRLTIMFLLITLTAAVMYQRFVLKQMPKLFGYSWAIVMTGSMEDTIMINDVIIIKESEKYEVGDVITFNAIDDRYGGIPITHRIVKIAEKDGRIIYTTKGDANKIVDDDIIYKEHIVGKVVKIVPYFRGFISWIRTYV